MINVRIDELSEGILFECEGHAEFAPKGTDIVCAGVSALCMALLGVMEEMSDEGEAQVITEHIAPGNIFLEVQCCGDKWSEIKFYQAVDTVRHGLLAIENLYPDYLQVQ